MYLTPALVLEIATAALIGVAFLWTRPEYALFLYGLALGFPDAACPLASTINLRVDDVLIVLLLARTILWIPAPLSRMQKTILAWQGLFFSACLLSVAIEAAQGNPPSGYDAARMTGCAVIFLVLPRLLETETRIRFFVAGLICGGIALTIQVHSHLGESASNRFANFQQMKSAAAFDTWNPNTIGQAAVLLVFAAGLGGILFSKTLANRVFWPALALVFALLPAMVFVRGTSLSISAGIALFLLISRRWKWMLVFALAYLCAVVYLRSTQRQFMDDATALNVSTGEGFSHRFDRWGTAIQAIKREPLAGHGFGQELPYLLLIGGEGRAHNAYLTVWLELGAGGLLLFLGAMFQFVRAGSFLYRSPQFRDNGALIVALMFTLALDSLGLPTLYWEKLTTIALCLAAAMVGVCERSEFEVSVRHLRTIASEPFAQHS